MKKKKKENFERTKAVFLLIVLIISSAFAASAFNLQSEIILPEVNVEPSEIIELLPTKIIKELIYEAQEPEDTIFVNTTKAPKFPGGEVAFRRWLVKNVNYPEAAKKSGIQGTVYLRFEVTKTGSIGKIELQKGVDKLLDEEAIRVIKKLPKFIPGMHNGKNVNVWYSIPISFKLN